MWVKHLSSLQFLTYVAFFAVVVAAICKFVPGKAAPVRETPYPEDELYAHDRKTAKYFVAGGLFLVLGSVHAAVKNLPWLAEYLARTGYAGHLVRDLSNTHLTIVGGGTLLATGLCWLALPRIVGRPLASEGLAQCAFWFTAVGLAIFYVSLVANGIAMGSLIENGWTYEAAKAHMGNWYKAPTGMGAGVMGLGYWCFATNVFITVFQARTVHVPKPQWHLWKFFATGAAALTVGTVQGVIQVAPGNADWLYRAGHAGEWIDPISHAHINLVTGLAMLVFGSLFVRTQPSRRLVDACFWSLLVGSLAFYFSALYLGFHEGGLVVHHGLSPEAAEEATPIHPFLIMGAGIAMFAAFWLLLVVAVRSVWRTQSRIRPFVLAGCAALAVGTLQGPVQAFPLVNEALDRGGQAGDVIVNLHAQLNMVGGLMMVLVGLALGALELSGAAWPVRRARLVVALVPLGVGVYYAAGVAFSAVEAHRIEGGTAFGTAVSSLEPWQALVLVPTALCVLVGFGAFASAMWRMTARQRAAGREAIAATPRVFSGKIPKRVVRRSPAALAGYELPLGLMGFPGVGWLFAGFPLTASVLLMLGPALTWAIIPVAFSPYGRGPLRGLGWGVELVWLPTMALVSSALLYRAHARRRARLEGRPPRGRTRWAGGYRTRVKVALGGIGLLLIAIPFVPAVAGVGGSTVRYSYEPRLTREVTGQFVRMSGGPVKLFSWSDPSDCSAPRAQRLTATARACTRASARARPLLLRRDARGHVRLARLRLPPNRAARWAGDRHQLEAAREGPGHPRRAAAALRGPGRARLRGLAAALAAAPPIRREGTLGGRFRALRDRGGLRGLSAAGRLEPGALPHLLPCRRRPDGCLPGRRLGLAPPTQAGARHPPRRAAGRHGGRGGDRRTRPGEPVGVGGDRSRSPAGQLCARRARVPLGDCAQLVRLRVPDRRLAVLDPARHSRAAQRLDRRRRARGRARDRPLASRLVQLRLRGRAARDRADVQRLRLRRET